MPDKPAAVAFLWHMHQPWYGDPLEPRFRLPWVRLHALKDYLDMVCVLDEHPEVKVTFNLVPSLLLQLQHYVDGTYTDDVIELTKRPAGELDDHERAWWMQMGFQIGWSRSIDPYPRYRQLLDLRGRRTPKAFWAERARAFGEQDMRDLQVWFSLAWCGYWLRSTNEVVKSLIAKGRDYSEDDKRQLSAELSAALALTIPKYAEAARAGRIEIATSPFYHPILPLLCHYPDVRAALPTVRLPAGQADLPEDATWHLQRGRELCTELTGIAPVGLWPSEGSVSTPALELASEAGFQWAATDEHILALSLQHRADPMHRAGRNPQAEDLVLPHRHGDMTLFFRHHYLSDRIGFDYHNWDARAAVGDLLGQIGAAAARGGSGTGRRPVVSIILDGENCWEQYHRNGWEFLNTLYSELAKHKSLDAVSFGDYVAEEPEAPRLDYLFPGSWIGHSFHIWAGHREDQRAWELVFQTRAALVYGEDRLDPETAQRCWQHLYIAEGSDWYWWYGEDNYSDDDPMFDALFRDHLRVIWEALGLPVPAALGEAIKGQLVPPPMVAPVAAFTPTLDGRETHFFEWRAAGILGGPGVGGAMQRASGVERAILKRVRYGFDADRLYFAVELDEPEAGALADPEWYLGLEWFAGGQSTVLRIPAPGQVGIRELEVLADGDHLALVAVGELVEIGLARDCLPAEAGDVVEFAITVGSNGQVVDRWPSQGAYDLTLPEPTAWLRDWLV